MALLAIVADLLLIFAAAATSFWWRGPVGYEWRGNACFYWGVVFLALFLTFPTIKPLFAGLR
jgi:hypothetical protein